MRALLVYAAFPVTYWGFQYGLPLAGKRSSLPPLGLMTVAAHLPTSWTLRLVDLNVEPLSDEDLAWAEVVFVGGMLIQGRSMREIIARARALGRRTVVGGPAVHSSPGEFAGADVIFSGEIEGREEELLEALAHPSSGVRHLTARQDALPAMSLTRVPRFDLIDFSAYASMSLQSSRGCPFACEFCDVIELFGRSPRVKTTTQVLAELTAYHRLGWRGSIFVVDDNFIGNLQQSRRLVTALGRWQQQQDTSFDFYTEASVNLARHPDLVHEMIDAGFSSVFLGLETSSKQALSEAGKRQNLMLDLSDAVAQLTRAGLEVMGGYIVGFDSDGVDAFAAQRRFILGSPIPHAMLGLLMALPGTALWRRLAREGRLRSSSSGDQLGRSNFYPQMDERTLLQGYAELVADLYAPDEYVRRCQAYIDQAPAPSGKRSPTLTDLLTLLRVIIRLGVKGRWRRSFWRLIGHALVRSPKYLRWAVTHAVQGEHLIRYTREDLLPSLEHGLAEIDAEAVSGEHPTRQRRGDSRAAAARAAG